MASNTRKETIYVSLLNEGTYVLRPTLGICLQEDIYKLLPSQHYDPEDEEWEFPPDTVVRTEKIVKGGETIIVAKEAVTEVGE